MSNPFEAPKASSFQLPARGSSAWERHKDRIDKTMALTCHRCGFVGPKLALHRGAQWYHALAAPVIIVVGAGIVGLLIVVAWMFSATPACAQCKETQLLEAYEGTVTREAKATWAAAVEEDKKALNRNRLIVLVTVVVIGVAVVVFVA